MADMLGVGTNSIRVTRNRVRKKLLIDADQDLRTLLESDLLDTAYHINEQVWLRSVIDGGQAIWTEPYFDEGGGNIWMKTRSVPVFVNGQIVAVATTDLSLE